MDPAYSLLASHRVLSGYSHEPSAAEWLHSDSLRWPGIRTDRTPAGDQIPVSQRSSGLPDGLFPGGYRHVFLHVHDSLLYDRAAGDGFHCLAPLPEQRMDREGMRRLHRSGLPGNLSGLFSCIAVSVSSGRAQEAFPGGNRSPGFLEGKGNPGALHPLYAGPILGSQPAASGPARRIPFRISGRRGNSFRF